MPEITLYNKEGQEIGSLSLPEEIFGVEPNYSLIHQAVTTEESNQRQGTASTKTRGNVRGGGRKPWRQKGTGRARQGSTRAPHWRHGGVVFGPHPRSYRKDFPKKMRLGAIRSALSVKVADGEMIAIDQLKLDAIKTKSVVKILNSLPLYREVRVKHYEGIENLVEGVKTVRFPVLIIVPEYDEILLKSCRNLPNVTLRYAPSFSVRDILQAGRVVLAAESVDKIKEALTK